MITVAGVDYAEMADSINPASLTSLPFTPDAFLGYTDGRWPDYQQIAADHPGVPVYGLTVLGNGQQGQGDDAEPGNIDIAQAVQDTIAELARGVDRPIKYCPQSWAHDMVTAHSQAGIQRDRYRLLTAHYQGPTMPGAPYPAMHICGAICGCQVEADGTQWASYPNYDRSLLKPGFITAAPHPGPAAPTIGEYMKLVQATNPATNTSAQYLIRTDDVLHVPDGTCSTWAYSEFNSGQGQLEAVPWEVILWLNKGQTPS